MSQSTTTDRISIPTEYFRLLSMLAYMTEDLYEDRDPRGPREEAIVRHLEKIKPFQGFRRLEING